MPQIDIYTKQQTDAKLDTKQATLDSTQLGAVNSGITAEKVGIYDGYATTISGKMDTSSFYTIGGTYSSENPVTTQSFVNSSISTNTATYKGGFTITDLDDTENPGQKLTANATNAQVAASLNAMTFTPAADNNDYCFIYVPAHEDSQQQAVASRYDRYKFAEDTATPANSTWAYEYTLNNSGFTAVQWEAINSGINSTKVGVYDGYATDIAGCVHKGTALSPSNEDIYGYKNITSVNANVWSGSSYSALRADPYDSTKPWIELAKTNFTLGSGERHTGVIMLDIPGKDVNSTQTDYAIFRFHCRRTTGNSTRLAIDTFATGINLPDGSPENAVFAMTMNSDYSLSIWFKQRSATLDMAILKVLFVTNNPGYGFEGKGFNNQYNTTYATPYTDALITRYIGRDTSNQFPYLTRDNILTGINTVPDITSLSTGGQIANKTYVDGKRTITTISNFTQLSTFLSDANIGDELLFSGITETNAGGLGTACLKKIYVSGSNNHLWVGSCTSCSNGGVVGRVLNYISYSPSTKVITVYYLSTLTSNTSYTINLNNAGTVSNGTGISYN